MSLSRTLIQPLEPRRLMTVSSGFSEDVVGDGLRVPTAMVVTPLSENPLILIAEKAGRIRFYQSGTLARDGLVQLEAVTDGDLGLVGIAVDKNYQRNRHVYVNYSYHKPGDSTIFQRVSRFYLAGDELIAEAVLLDLPSWEGSTTRIGGGLKFAFDGTLLIGVGDGGKKERAGDLGSPFGKILRIRPDGTVPSNNPFADAEGWQKYVWAYGLRDPAKFAVSSQNGITYINDPGEKTAEEINLGVAGGNYGWPTVEGGAATPVGSNPIGPVVAIPHAPTDPEAVAGGHIGGGAIFVPGTLTFPVPYAGDYFFVDRDSNIVQVMAIDKLTPTGLVSPFATDIIRPIDVGYTIPGDLFVVTQGIGDAGGQLIRYRATGAPSIVRQPAGATLVPGQSTKLTVNAGGYAPLTYQWKVNGQDIPGANKPTLTVGPFGPAEDGTSYTVRVTNDRGVAQSAPAVIHIVSTGGGTDGGTDGGGTDGGGAGGGGTDGGGTDGGGTGGGTGGGGTGGGPSPFNPPKDPPPLGPIDLLPMVSAMPFSAVGGTTSKVAVKVLNVGLDIARGEMLVRLHLSPTAEASVGSTDPVIGETEVKIRIVPGKAKSLRMKVAWPDGLDGDYYLLASADPANRLIETNEANNVAVGSTLSIRPGFIDVRTQVGTTPASATSGKPLSLPVSLYNDGNRASASDLTLLVWAVPKSAYDAGATPAEAASVGTAVFTQAKRLVLPAGRGKSVKLKFVLPESLPAGDYVLVATADGVPGESNATNNASVGAGIVGVA